MNDVILVLVTAPSEEKAAEIGRIVVEEGLAACANIFPKVRSIYRWEGKLCDEPEALMFLKTRKRAFDALKDRVAALHPYQVPAIVQLGVEAGHAPYLDWVKENVPGG